MTGLSTYLRRGGLALVAIGVGGFAADFALNVGLTRLLAAHEYGDFKVARAFVSLFGVAVLLGGDRAAPKVLAGPLAAGERARAWEYLRFFLRVSLALSGVVILGTWAASLLHVGSADPAAHHALTWLAVSIPISAAGALASRGLQSGRMVVLSTLPWRVGLPGVHLVLVCLLFAIAGSITLAQTVALAIVTVALLAAWQWWELRRRLLPRFRRDPSWRAPRRWLADSIPMMGAVLVTIALEQSDVYFLELLGDEDEVGRYSAAATTAHLLTLIQVTVVALIAPLAQPAIDAGPAASRDTRRQGERLMLAGLLPAALVLVLGARPILSLFGPGYPDAATVLGLLVIGAATWSAAALSVLWLQYTDRGGVVVGIAVATLAVDSLLNALLIPRYGMEGAAAGTALTMTLAAAAVFAVHRASPTAG